MTQWYYKKSGTDHGPISWEQLKTLSKRDKIDRDTPVKRDSDKQWHLARDVAGLFPRGMSRDKRSKPLAGCLPLVGGMGIGVLLLLVCAGVLTNDRQSERSSRPGSHVISQQVASDSTTQSKPWYEGGTLHNKSILEWQLANDENKLATCCDFVAKMWDQQNFVPTI